MSAVELGPAEPQKCCAYNETKLRFLGLDIDAGDFTVASFEDRLSALTPKSGAGIWLLPFRGISASSVHIPVDLLYLDRNGTVLDAVESFPISRFPLRYRRPRAFSCCRPA